MTKRITDRVSVRCGACSRLVAWAGTAMAALAMLAWSSSATAGSLLNCIDVKVFDWPKLSLPADADIGATLWTQDVTLETECGRSTITPPPPQELYFARVTADIGNGVSVYVTYRGDRGGDNKVFNTGTIINGWDTPGVRDKVQIPVTLELVKTGIMNPDKPILIDWSLVFAKAGGVDVLTAVKGTFYTRGHKNIQFIPSTCTALTPSVIVGLGSVATNASSGFGSGIGTTSPSRGFDVVLNCGAALANGGGLGRGITLQLDGTLVSGFESQGVLALSSAGEIAATGLGIQVLKDSGLPVTFGTSSKVGVFTMDRQQITVPFSARYYQTRTSVTPGEANGVATFTIGYL